MHDDLKGFFYHYKHRSDDPVQHQAYEFLNIARNTEKYESDEGKFLIYRPLYNASIYEEGKLWNARPLSMVLEPVDKPEYKGPRFIKITDESVLAELRAIRDTMYGGK